MQVAPGAQTASGFLPLAVCQFLVILHAYLISVNFHQPDASPHVSELHAFTLQT